MCERVNLLFLLSLNPNMAVAALPSLCCRSLIYAAPRQLSDIELFILDTIITSVCARVCELMCLSAHQLIRWCLVSASLTNVFPVPTLEASHFLFNGGEQEIVCHLPIICDSSCVWRQSVKICSRPPLQEQQPGELRQLCSDSSHHPPSLFPRVRETGVGVEGGRGLGDVAVPLICLFLPRLVLI